MTLVRPKTGVVYAKGVCSAPQVVLHPWLQEQVLVIREQRDQEPLPVRVPVSDEHPLMRTWQQWWWSSERPKPAPPLRLILIWDTLAGQVSSGMVRWLLQHGMLPLSPPVSGSWLTMAESLQRIMVRRALAGQHPHTAQHVLDWLEETVAGWNQHPTPCVWHGTRRQRRERARLRRLGGSGAALVNGSSIAG